LAWSPDQLEDQTGRVALVTGANSGIGLWTAQALAQAGAQVVLACRSRAKADDALARLSETPVRGGYELLSLDLADLASVRACAEQFMDQHQRLDLLINNAGVMIPPFGQTRDGFELQFGTNHLGHFALTGLLLDRLTQTRGSRVVTVASNAHRWGRIRFADLNWSGRYNRWLAYGQSKVANLLFAYELERRLSAAGHTTRSLAAHPGWAFTGLVETSGLIGMMTPWFAQSARAGAAPTLRAATDPDAAGGAYYGPRWLEMRGRSVRVRSSGYSRRVDVAQRLWQISETLTGVAWLSE